MGDNILVAMTISLILTKFNLHDSVVIFREMKLIDGVCLLNL